MRELKDGDYTTFTCLSCTRPIPSRYSMLGYVQGSLWLFNRDKAMLFCTMRCAASYGIRVAKGNLAPEVYSKRHERASAIREKMERLREERIAADKAAREGAPCVKSSI